MATLPSWQLVAGTCLYCSLVAGTVAGVLVMVAGVCTHSHVKDVSGVEEVEGTTPSNF